MSKFVHPSVVIVWEFMAFTLLALSVRFLIFDVLEVPSDMREGASRREWHSVHLAEAVCCGTVVFASLLLVFGLRAVLGSRVEAALALRASATGGFLFLASGCLSFGVQDGTLAGVTFGSLFAATTAVTVFAIERIMHFELPFRRLIGVGYGLSYFIVGVVHSSGYLTVAGTLSLSSLLGIALYRRYGISGSLVGALLGVLVVAVAWSPGPIAFGAVGGFLGGASGAVIYTALASVWLPPARNS